jgi:hypothetical protein
MPGGALLGEPEKRRACDDLAAELHTPTGAPVAVGVFLLVGEETDLARRVITEGGLDEPIWDSLAGWYLGIRDTASLSYSHRIRLVNALDATLAREHAEAFLRSLTFASPADDLPELFDNPEIHAYLRVRLVTHLMGTFMAEAPPIDRVAHRPEFMVLAGG